MLPTLPLPLNSSLTSLLLLLLLLTPNPTSSTPAPATLPPQQQRNDLTDPFKYQIPNAPIYLLLSGFLSTPQPRFSPSQLLDLAQTAQMEIAREVLPRGDAAIHTPNQEWCSWHGGPQPVCLRVNWPYIDKVVTWRDLSHAVQGVAEFGILAGFVACPYISIVDKGRRGVIGRAELLVGRP